jgi:hypothetical protein
MGRLFDISTGTETPAGTGEHHDGGCGVGHAGRELLAQRGQQLLRQGVEALRAVQTDPPYRTFLDYLQNRHGHPSTLFGVQNLIIFVPGLLAGSSPSLR